MSRLNAKAARNFAAVKWVMLVAVAAAAAGAQADDASVRPRANSGSMSGAQIYEHVCAGCHMSGGQGAVGAGFYPKLAANKKLVSWEYVALTVLNGRNGMPPFGLPADQMMFGAAHFSDAQIADVVNYVRSHLDNHYTSEVTAKQVAALPHPAASLQGPQ